MLSDASVASFDAFCSQVCSNFTPANWSVHLSGGVRFVCHCHPFGDVVNY